MKVSLIVFQTRMENGCYCGSKIPFLGKSLNVCLLVSASYLLSGKDLASSCSIIV